MKKPIISIIAAIGKNRELGKDNKLLWNIPEDMKRFRDLTKGHVVIMGRKTFESIGKPLPNRINIIVSRDKDFEKHISINQLINTYVIQSIDKAIQLARKKETRGEIFVIGGGQIYEQSMDYTDKLYLTIVDGSFKADAFFPDYSQFKNLLFKEDRTDGKFRYIFFVLEK